jgi:hypothetical protein
MLHHPFLKSFKCMVSGWFRKPTIASHAAIPIDQAHEQNIALVKGSDGAGLTENLSYPF